MELCNLVGGFSMPVTSIWRSTVLPVLVGAVVCAALAWSVYLGPLFLIPIGVLAFRYPLRISILGGLLATVFSFFIYSAPSFAFWPYTFYFGASIAILIWTIRFSGLRLSYRLIIASIAGTLALGPIVWSLLRDPAVMELFKQQTKAVISMYEQASSADVVQRSIIEQQMTPEGILKSIEFLGLRGVAVAFHMVFFFFSWQVAQFFSRSTQRRISFIQFHVVPAVIWVVSVSLVFVLAGTAFSIPPLEIAGWNMATLALFLYLAQGIGVFQFRTLRFYRFPLGRFMVNFVTLLILFSPGINAIALGSLVILGIVENWVPLRVLKSNGPSSTPGV